MLTDCLLEWIWRLCCCWLSIYIEREKSLLNFNSLSFTKICLMPNLLWPFMAYPRFHPTSFSAPLSLLYWWIIIFIVSEVHYLRQQIEINFPKECKSCIALQSRLQIGPWSSHNITTNGLCLTSLDMNGGGPLYNQHCPCLTNFFKLASSASATSNR